MTSQTYFAPADRRAIVLPGVPADNSYSFSVQAYRRVHKDISATGVILSGTALSTPYRPTVTPAFNGDITGTIQGRGSLDVVLNLEAISSDAILSTTEKPALILSYNQLFAQLSSLEAKVAEIGGFAVELSAAQVAFSTLTDYLESLTPLWNSVSQHTPISQSAFQIAWASAYSAIAALSAAITGRAGPTIFLTPSRVAFTYVNGVLTPPVQTATITAELQSLTGPIAWTTSPNVKTGAGTTFTLTPAELGTHESVVVKATVGDVSQSIAIGKLAGSGSTNGADVNSNIIDGTTGQLMTRAQLITALGISAGFTGQGPGATATGAEVLNYRTDATNLTTVVRPEGGSYNENAHTATGALQIELPISWSDSMLRFYVDVFDYAEGGMQTYLISGYSYDQENRLWYNCSAQMVGGSGAARPIRFGVSASNKSAIWIGDPAGTWSYPQFVVRDVQVGFYNTHANYWKSGWLLSRVTSLGTVRREVLKPVAGDMIFGQNAFESWGGPLATKANFKTAEGISSGFTGQGWGATADQKALDNSYIQTNYIIPWGATVSGNTMIRASGTQDYNAAAYADRINGPCYVSQFITSSGWNMVSLDNDIGDKSYTAMTVMAHYHPTVAGGTLNWYVNGVPVNTTGGVGNWSGNELQLVYDGSFFRVMLGGYNIHSTAAPANLALYPVWHAYEAGVRHYHLRSGPAKSAARIGSNTYDNSGNLKNSADLITPEGISAGFTGQGGLATRNDVGTAHIQVGAVSGDRLAIGAKGQNLVANPCGADLTTNGWATVEGVSSGAGLFPVQYYRPGRRGFGIGINPGELVAYGVRACPVTPGKTYVWRFTWGGSAAATAGAYHRLNYSAVLPPNGYVDGSNRLGYTDLLSNGAVPSDGVPHLVEYVWTCPSDVNWVSPAIYNWGAAPVIYFSDFEFFDQATEKNLASNAVRLGGNVVQGNGTTPVTDASAITALGVSAGFTGQGYLATQNYSYLGVYGAGGIARSSGTGYHDENTLETIRGTAAGFQGQGPGATASGQDVLNYNEAGGVTTIRRPGGGSYSFNGGAIWGAIKIALPVSNSHTMIRFYVDIYDYQAGGTTTYLVSGYPYGSAAVPAWENVSAQMVGSSQYAKMVRFGWDGEKSCVWIGGTDSYWSYPQVTVRDFQGGYNAYLASSWNAGWVVSMDTVGPTIVAKLVARPVAGDAIMGENVLEAPGTPATNANYKTNQGISAGFHGQGLLATQNSVAYGSGFVTGFGTFAALSQINAGNITNYIANQAIGSAVIANAAIGTAHIDQIAVSKIVANDLSSLSANIGLLRTRTTGARLELESNEIRAYHANGNLAFRLSGSA